MSITYTIPGARALDQLDEPTFDGHSDEDANDNCVPTSLAEGLNILAGDGAQKYVGDELKDNVYGQGWTGFQSAAHYVAYCADQGVTLAAHNASQAGLIAIIHDEVAAGHPVVVTMPSQWSTAPIDPVHPSGTTHVGLAVGIGPGMVRVMNPWHGFMQDASDDWWAARLCEGQVWTMQRAASVQTNANNSAQPTGEGTNVTTAATSTAGQPTPFYGLVYTSDSQRWACPSTGHSVALGFLHLYQGLRGPNGEVATQLAGLPISDEYRAPDGKTRQDFERAAFIYDAGGAAGWQFYYAPLGKELQQAQGQVAQTSAALASAKQQAALDEQVIAAQKQQIADLSSKLTTSDAALQAAQRAAQAAAATPAPTSAPAPDSSDELTRAAAHAFGLAFGSAFASALASVAPIPPVATPSES